MLYIISYFRIIFVVVIFKFDKNKSFLWKNDKNIKNLLIIAIRWSNGQIEMPRAKRVTQTRTSESLRRQVFDSTARVVDRRCYAPVRAARSARLVLAEICALPLLSWREKDYQNSRTQLMKRSLRDYAYAETHMYCGSLRIF